MSTLYPPPSAQIHPVLQTKIDLEPSGANKLIFLAAGCFWGVERILWETSGVASTAVGYMGGHSENPTYVQVCTGITGHAETVRVVYDTSVLPTSELLATFFENHDPTQLDRQGNDLGSQYRGAIWTTDMDQFDEANRVKALYQKQLDTGNYGKIVTHIHQPPPPPFYFAEDYHQGYLFKNPDGYCNHGFNGVACPRPSGA